MADGLPGGAGASPPSFILDLGSAHEGGTVCFLLVYMKKDGTLADLALVSEDAVFSTRANQKGLEGCVYKPPSRKSLKNKDHIAKVGQALEAVAAADAAADAAAAGADDPPSSAKTTTTAVPKAATLALEIASKDSAKLTLKEVKSLGAVDLAVVTLPIVAEVGGGSLLRGLLLGAAAEAHKRTKEAEVMGRDRDKARKEQVKVQGLLDGAIRDKRKTVTNILEKAVLVVNAKKNRIDELEERIEKLEDDDGGSVDQESSICDSGGSGGSGGEEDELDTDDEGRNIPSGTNKRKGKAPARAQAPGGRGSEPTNRNKGKNDGSDGRGAAGAAAAAAAAGGGGSGAGEGGPSSPRVRGPGRGRGGGGNVKIKSEPKLGAGGGALATPMGTQELSQDELFDLVDAKVKTEGAGVSSGDRGDDGHDTSRRRNQRGDGGNRLSLKHPRDSDGPEDDDDDDGDDDDDIGAGAGDSEAALYVGDLGGSSDSDGDGNAGQAPQRVRRRRKVKKSSTIAAAQGGSSSGGGGGGGGSGSGASAPATEQSTGVGSGSGEAAEKTGLTMWEALAADSDEDLAGLK